MITVYKNADIAKKYGQVVPVNDVFFNIHTSAMVDKKAADIISSIDGAKLQSRFKIVSSLDNTVLNVDKLSTGCKTALNVFYNPEIIFDIRECGDNALAVIYAMAQGRVYSDYACIPLDMPVVLAVDEHGSKEIDDYCDMKEWWEDEY